MNDTDGSYAHGASAAIGIGGGGGGGGGRAALAVAPPSSSSHDVVANYGANSTTLITPTKATTVDDDPTGLPRGTTSSTSRDDDESSSKRQGNADRVHVVRSGDGGGTRTKSATKWPPASSSRSLPPLSGRMHDLWRAANSTANATIANTTGGGEGSRGGMKDVGGSSSSSSRRSDVIEFEVNQECTSIGLVPSGRLAVAGFTDGTLRLFDLTGIFVKDKNHPALYRDNDNNNAGIGGVSANNVDVYGNNNAATPSLWNGWDRARNGIERPEYLLCTGKGIKNEDSIWTCLYDTQTNGTSINQLYFRHNLHGTLQAISKSDDQKLRVWDLTYEQTRIANGSDGSDRPKRPDYVDVASTEGTVGVCGPYAFASGSLGGMHNIINVVGLDADDVSSPFNCTELMLPVECAGSECNAISCNRTSRTGRQQRGDLKSVEHVAGLVFDASHALIQLSDGSVVHYLHDRSGHPMLLQSPPSLCTTSIDDDSYFGVTPGTAGLNQIKKMALARVGSQAMVLFAVSSFNENTSRGAIMLRALPGGGVDDRISGKSFRRYWGFNGLKKSRKQKQASIETLTDASMASSAATKSPVGASVGLISVESTSTPVVRSHENIAPVVTSVAHSHRIEGEKSILKIQKRMSKEGHVESTPGPFSRIDCKPRKVSPDVRDLTPAYMVSKVENSSSACKNQHEDDGMDSQLDLIVRGAALSPKISKIDCEKFPSDKNFETVKKHKMAKGKQIDDVISKKKQKTSVQDEKKVVEMEVMPKPLLDEKNHLTSPSKQRGRRKTQSPIPPQSSPANDFEFMAPVGNEHINITASGYLGVTILDRRDKVHLPESCYKPKLRPVLLVEQLPKSTVQSRLTNDQEIQTSSYPKKITTTTTDDLHYKRHCDERRQLAAKHRAEHEMIRKRVLHSIRYALSTWDVELHSNKPHAIVVDSAKRWFDDALACHQEMLDDMLGRQTMEAESLAARQTSELVHKRAPALRVSFPFPQVFEQARQEMISMIK
ncbi:hypothetical protein ACHAXA_004289 [Cyclostephanos tholiformis]|uniref:Uncharacterized protein n=1 Tax=Cyclostephanos tholiformis TaxID=382380 RepID=A0ABD3SFU3_9STRA